MITALSIAAVLKIALITVSAVIGRRIGLAYGARVQRDIQREIAAQLRQQRP